jgi:hypothetical protein
MNFKKATDELLASVTLQDLADALGVSVQSVRQARVEEGSSAHRSPPPEWERGVSRLATKRSERLQRLAGTLANTRKT